MPRKKAYAKQLTVSRMAPFPWDNWAGLCKKLGMGTKTVAERLGYSSSAPRYWHSKKVVPIGAYLATEALLKDQVREAGQELPERWKKQFLAVVAVPVQQWDVFVSFCQVIGVDMLAELPIMSD